MYGDTDDELRKKLVRSFIDKTFDIVFHVTAPVVSDWHAYMVAALSRSLGDDIAQTWGRHVVAMYSKRVSGRVTPRDINRQVNAIAALWMQWREESIAFPIVSYYSIFRDQLDDDLMLSIKHPAVDLEEFGEYWQRSLAAIHFGVEPQNALQVLLAPEILEAIGDLDQPRFLNQSTIKGFDGVLIRVLGEYRSDFTFVRKTAELMSQCDREILWKEWFWSRIRFIWLQSDLSSWLRNGTEAALLLDIILKREDVAERQIILAFVAKQVVSWKQPDEILRSAKAQKDYTQILRIWLRHARLLEVQPIRLENIKTYLDIAELLINEHDAIRLITVDAGADELAASLSFPSANSERVGFGRQAEVIIRLGPTNKGLGFLLNAVRQRLVGSDWGSEVVEEALDLAIKLRSIYPPAKEWFAEFASDGGLIRLTVQALGKWTKIPAAKLLALCMIHNIPLPHIGNDGWIDIGATEQAFISELVTRIVEFGGKPPSVIDRYGEEGENKSLIDALLLSFLQGDGTIQPTADHNDQAA
jgi:hypothetical protein